MGIFIAAVLLGIGFTLFSIQNSAGVTLNAGGYLFPGVPIFLVVLGSLLLGLLIAWFLSAIGWISNSLTMQQKNSKIKEATGTVRSLEARIKDLEIENARLKAESPHSKTFLSRFRGTQANGN